MIEASISMGKPASPIRPTLASALAVTMSTALQPGLGLSSGNSARSDSGVPIPKAVKWASRLSLGYVYGQPSLDHNSTFGLMILKKAEAHSRGATPMHTVARKVASGLREALEASATTLLLRFC
jgi:hypothetical protein